MSPLTPTFSSKYNLCLNGPLYFRGSIFVLRVDIKLNPCLYVYQPGAVEHMLRYANRPSIREKMVFLYSDYI